MLATRSLSTIPFAIRKSTPLITSSVNFDNGAPNYTHFFDMKIVAGRTFRKDNPNNEYLVNETLARDIGYDDPVGKAIHLTSFPPGRIVGVVKDYNYSSLHTRIEPLLIASIDYVPIWQSQLYIKVAAGNIRSAVNDVTKKLRLVTGDNTLSPEFLDEHFRQTYDAERQAGTIIAVIGALAISIACLGLFGLAAFVIVRPTPPACTVKSKTRICPAWKASRFFSR